MHVKASFCIPNQNGKAFTSVCGRGLFTNFCSAKIFVVCVFFWSQHKARAQMTICCVKANKNMYYDQPLCNIALDWPVCVRCVCCMCLNRFIVASIAIFICLSACRTMIVLCWPGVPFCLWFKQWRPRTRSIFFFFFVIHFHIRFAGNFPPHKMTRTQFFPCHLCLCVFVGCAAFRYEI